MAACANIYSPCSIRGSHYRDWLFTCLSPSTVSLANMKSNGILERGRIYGCKLVMHSISDFASQADGNNQTVCVSNKFLPLFLCMEMNWNARRWKQIQMIATVERVAHYSVFLPLIAPCKLAERPCELSRQLICDTQVPCYPPAT